MTPLELDKLIEREALQAYVTDLRMRLAYQHPSDVEWLRAKLARAEEKLA